MNLFEIQEMNFIRLVHQLQTIMFQTRLSRFNFVFRLICLIGFLYQISEICVEYFSYKTNTKVVLLLDDKFNNPSIIFCTRYTDIIDRTNYEKYGIHEKSSYNTTEYLSDQSKLKINDVFDLTPKPEDAMVGCQIHENDYTKEAKDYCYSLFNVTKYLEGTFICYQFRTKMWDMKFKCDHTVLSYDSFNQLYRISLHLRFLLSNGIKLISWIPNELNCLFSSLPYVSRKYHDFSVRFGYDAPDTSKINYIFISGDFHIISRLQSPYDTHCVENQEQSDFYCKTKCNIASFKRHNLFPPNEMTSSSLPMKHFNVETVKNESLIRYVKESSDKCMMQCNSPLCEDWFSVTTTKSYPSKEDGFITISSTCSNRPAIVIQYLPRVTLMELAIYASSSLGIWFGVSIFAINPFKGNQKQCPKTTKQGIDLRFFRQTKCDSTIKFQTLVQDLDRRMGEIESFREIIRVAVQKLNRKVKQMESKQLY